MSETQIWNGTAWVSTAPPAKRDDYDPQVQLKNPGRVEGSYIPAARTLDPSELPGSPGSGSVGIHTSPARPIAVQTPVLAAAQAMAMAAAARPRAIQLAHEDAVRRGVERAAPLPTPSLPPPPSVIGHAEPIDDKPLDLEGESELPPLPMIDIAPNAEEPDPKMMEAILGSQKQVWTGTGWSAPQGAAPPVEPAKEMTLLEQQIAKYRSLGG